MEAEQTKLYIHLIPKGQKEIKESFKLNISSNNTINQLCEEISRYLESRNDGNKIYSILSIKSQENGKPLSGGRYISSYFTGDSKSNCYVFTNCLESNDVYCTLECTIDTTKYVKPISVAQTEEAKIDKSGAFTQKDVDKIIRNYDGKMKTLTTYSYYESSNGEWVKATVAVDNIKDHPKDKIEVIFTERTLDVFLKDIGAKKDEIYHFGCRKLHRYIVPEKCRWVVKNDGVYVSLKKKSKEDHWWSFFKAKATGEEDSDIEEQKKSK